MPPVLYYSPRDSGLVVAKPSHLLGWGGFLPTRNEKALERIEGFWEARARVGRPER